MTVSLKSMVAVFSFKLKSQLNHFSFIGDSFGNPTEDYEFTLNSINNSA
jgi:hypothetical protein